MYTFGGRMPPRYKLDIAAWQYGDVTAMYLEFIVVVNSSYGICIYNKIASSKRKLGCASAMLLL